MFALQGFVITLMAFSVLMSNLLSNQKRQYQKIQERNKEIQEIYGSIRNTQESIILSMIKILEVHDDYTKGHSENVAELSKKLAKTLGLGMSEYVYHHHERWDGKGYSEKLKGDEIPLSARIFAVVKVHKWLSRIGVIKIKNLILISLSFLMTAEASAVKDILVLHSYHQGLEWTDQISEGIRSVFPYKDEVTIYYLSLIHI